jgi:6-phosphogluconate dehydrogenase (decarboxylating)
MDTEHARNEYGEYFLLVRSEILFPRWGFALVYDDGFTYEGGLGVGDYVKVSADRIPYGTLRRLERVRERLEILEAERMAECEG